jgi:ubiquitin-conjugating enzyme E2 H
VSKTRAGGWTSFAEFHTDYVTRYASKDAADEAGAESDEDDDMSSVGSFGDDEDEEPAGPMEEV